MAKVAKYKDALMASGDLIEKANELYKSLQGIDDPRELPSESQVRNFDKLMGKIQDLAEDIGYALDEWIDVI